MERQAYSPDKLGDNRRSVADLPVSGSKVPDMDLDDKESLQVKTLPQWSQLPDWKRSNQDMVNQVRC